MLPVRRPTMPRLLVLTGVVVLAGVALLLSRRAERMAHGQARMREVYGPVLAANRNDTPPTDSLGPVSATCRQLAARRAAEWRGIPPLGEDALADGPNGLLEVRYRRPATSRIRSTAATVGGVVVGRLPDEWPATGFLVCMPATPSVWNGRALRAFAHDPLVWEVVLRPRRERALGAG